MLGRDQLDGTRLPGMYRLVPDPSIRTGTTGTGAATYLQ